MKILYIITKSEAGGAQTHVAELCKYFKSNGKEVAVLSYPGGWLETEVEQLGIKFFANKYFSNSLNPVRVIKAYLETKKVIKEFRPDLVHCHSSAAGAYGRLAIRNKIKTLYTAHGWGFNIGVPFLQKWAAIFIERYLSKYCIKIICVSDFVKNLGLKFRIASEDKFVVVKNGVSIKEKSINSVVKKIKIIFVGRLAEPKDPLFLLKAISGLSNELKEKIEVLIIGDGPQKNSLENFIEIEKLDFTSLLGSLPREEIFVNLKESDIFVLISKWEGLPITILEAMSCGLPVIASEVGGIPEAVDKNCGILIKNSEINELSLALFQLIQNKELREKMGINAQEKIKEKFLVERMLTKTSDVYKQVID